MRVERASVDQVKERFRTIRRRLEEEKSKVKVSAVDEYEARIAQQLIEEEEKKKKKRELALAKKTEKEAAELENADPEIAEILGFVGFGGSKKS